MKAVVVTVVSASSQNPLNKSRAALQAAIAWESLDYLVLNAAVSVKISS